MLFEKVYFVALEKEFLGIFDERDFKSGTKSGFQIYKNRDKKIVVILTGVGKSNAAAAAQLALQSFPAKKYLNVGLVGAFNSKLKLAEVIKVEKCRFFDVDLTAFNHEPGQLFGCELAEYPLETMFEKQKEFLTLKSVFLVSGDTFTSHFENQVVRQFHPDVVDMELTSIAHIFYLHKKLDHLQSIKAISDHVNAKSHNDFFENMSRACGNLKQFFLTVGY